MSDIRIQKTGEPDILQTSDGRLTLSVPIQIKRRSGRKLVTLPNGETPEFDTKRPFWVFSDRRPYWNQQLSRVALIFL